MGRLFECPSIWLDGTHPLFRLGHFDNMIHFVQNMFENEISAIYLIRTNACECLRNVNGQMIVIASGYS